MVMISSSNPAMSLQCCLQWESGWETGWKVISRDFSWVRFLFIYFSCFTIFSPLPSCQHLTSPVTHYDRVHCLLFHCSIMKDIENKQIQKKSLIMELKFKVHCKLWFTVLNNPWKGKTENDLGSHFTLNGVLMQMVDRFLEMTKSCR